MMSDEERMIAEAEAIAAHWRKAIGDENVYELSRQILRLLRKQKDADNAALRARVAELEAGQLTPERVWALALYLDTYGGIGEAEWPELAAAYGMLRQMLDESERGGR